jgi:bleomycin hydrolase
MQPYNLPLDEMIQVIDASVEQGYTVAWASDVTEPGFSWREGIAISPKKADKGIFEEPVPEITVSQQLRQEEFDNYQTTDDHGMHIIGFANDVKGNKYYYVKNSWGINNAQKGYIFASENFVRYKTMSILVNKNAIPEEILLKLKME